MPGADMKADPLHGDSTVLFIEYISQKVKRLHILIAKIKASSI